MMQHNTVNKTMIHLITCIHNIIPVSKQLAKSGPSNSVYNILLWQFHTLTKISVPGGFNGAELEFGPVSLILLLFLWFVSDVSVITVNR